MAPITSFIRWAGGKSWLVPYVAQLTKGLDYNNYYEPFMGGASIFFSLDLPNKGCLSDINDELINAFAPSGIIRKELFGILRNMK